MNQSVPIMPHDEVEQESDELLMGRLAQGDRRAYQLLLGRHLPSFLGFAGRIMGTQAQAEDVMQDAFLKLWVNAPQWDPKRQARFTTWFYRIVMNLCIDHKRRLRPSDDLSDASDIAAADPDGYQSMVSVQKAEILQQAMSSLPDRQRDVLILRYFQGLKGTEIAAIMGISVNAVDSLLVRGRKKLAILLESRQHELLEKD